jgi:hypothetical protein
MTQSETEEDGCDGESGDEEQSEEGDNEVEVVKSSGSLVSVTPIFRLSCQEYVNAKSSCGKKWPKMSRLLLWTAGCGTKLNLRDGTTLPQSSHSETSICPSTSGC